VNSSRDHSRGDDGPAAAAKSRDGTVPHADTDAAGRLGAIESELAFQVETQRELGDALAAQQMDILTLQRQVHLLGEQLAALRNDVSPAEPHGSDDEPPPPHY
jgi:uncharacterized coiled-coil protein SlyX